MKKQRLLRTSFVPVLAAIAMTLASSLSVRAASLNWINTGTDMNTGTSWNRQSVPTSGDSVYFNGAGGINPNLSASLTLQQLVFSGSGYNLSTSSGQTITLTNTGTATSNALQYYSAGANTISGNLVLGGALPQTFNMVGSGHLTISGTISGTQALSLAGEPGTVTLSGINTFTGNFSTSKVGMVNINNNNALGAGIANLAGSNALIRLGNTSGGNITVANTLAIGTSGAFIYSSANNLTFSGATTIAGTIPFYVGGGGGSLILSGGIAATASGLTKSGVGNLVLGGTNLYTGATTLNQGTLVLDKGLNSGSMVSTNTLTLAGGGFTLKGAASGTSSQTLGNPTFNAGANKITIDSNGGSGTTLTLGNTWNTAAGRSLNINLVSANTTLTSNPALTNGLIGGTDAFATVTDSGGTGFATVVGGNVTRSTTESNLTSGSNSTTTNFVENTSGTLMMAATNSNVNTLRVDTTSTGASGVLDLNSSRMTLAGRGLLVTGTNDFTIQNGLLGAGVSTLYLHQFSSGTLTVNATTDFGTFIKDGTGTVTFSGSNANTVNTYVNEGTVNITGKWSGATTSSATTISGGVLSLQNATTAAINNGTVTVQGSGTLTETAGTQITGAATRLIVNGPSATANLLANSYGGNSTLTLGSVNVGDKSSFGTGQVIFSGATVSSTANLTGANAIANAYLVGSTGGATGTTVYFAGSNNLELSGAGNMTQGQTIKNSMAASATLTLSGNFSIEGTNTTLIFTGSGKTAISGNISMVSSGSKIVKLSTGTLTLSGTNTYAGQTQVSAGVLMLASAGALPGGVAATGGLSNLALSNGVVGLTTATGDFTRGLGSAVTQVQWVSSQFGGGGGGFAAYGANRIVNLSGNQTAVTWASNSFVADGYDLILGAPDADSTLDFQNPINLNSVLRTVQVDNGSAATDAKLSGVLSSGGLVKTGAGNLELTAANTYSLQTLVQAGTLSFNTGNTTAAGVQALGRNATVNLGVALNSSGILNYNGIGAATLAKDINALGNGTDTIQNSGTGLLTLGGTLTKNGTVLTLKGGSNGINVTGTIAGSAASSDLIVDGGNTTLSAANSYNGPTYIINGATLNASFANALPTANGRTAVIMDQTGSGTSTLALGVSQSIASLTGNTTSTVTLGSTTLTINATSGSTTFSGNISGPGGSLVKDGSSTQILSGTNTYTGTTTISSGTLLINGSTSSSSLMSVNGGTLGGTGTVGGDTVLAAGSMLSPGDSSAVTFHFSNALNISAAANDTAAFVFTLGAASDKVVAGGLLTFGTNLLEAADFSFTAGAGFAQNVSYILFSGGSVSGSFTSFAVTDIGGSGINGNVALAGSDIVLTTVPEPATWALLAFSLTTVMVLRRRRA